MFWFIICRAIEDFFLETDYLVPENAEMYPDTFIVNYGLQHNSVYHNAVTLTYFAFTSLSTVGFGDYAPISNTERLIGAFILLLGVAIFSYIMGNFIEILERFQKFNEDIEEDELLNKFFGTIKQFNNQENINYRLKRNIEKFFEYRWNFNKNVAFDGEGSQSIIEQIQTNDELYISLLKDFIYKDFLMNFSKTFDFPNMQSPY